MDPESLLHFWFGDNLDDPQQVAERCSLWFGNHPSFDAQIRQRFGDLPARGAEGRLVAWQKEPRMFLALVLALDQLPRNLYRGEAAAFAFDRMAADLAVTAIARRIDKKVHPVEAAFFYLPLEHAEDLVLQDRAVQLFERLCKGAPHALHKVLRGFHDYALRHRQVIQRFGRFPHRNAVLGRSSTPEEEAYLDRGGETFGSGRRN